MFWTDSFSPIFVELLTNGNRQTNEKSALLRRVVSCPPHSLSTVQRVLAMPRIASVLVLSALSVSVTTCTKKPPTPASLNTAPQRAASPRTPKLRSNDAEEAAVYAAVIESFSVKLGHPVLVASEMARASACGNEGPKVKSETSPWRSAVDDYQRRKAAGGIIGPALPLSASAYEVLTTTAIKRLAPPKNQTVVRYLVLTAVGFDTTRMRAVLHHTVACVALGLCAEGGDLFLEKQSGTWRLVHPKDLDGMCFWIS